MNKVKNKYKIEQNLVEVMINKVTKDKKKYGNSLIPLSDDELQKKIKEFQAQGFSVNTYHQEEFDDGYRFIKDREGLEDITSMTYADLKRLLNQCQREVKAICKKEILNGNIEQIRKGKYPFGMGKRVYNILLKYVMCHKRPTSNIIPFECSFYLVSCLGNILQLRKIIDKLWKKHIYLYFLNSGYITNNFDDICFETDYPSTFTIEYYLELLLWEMYYNNELSEEEYEKYAYCPYDFDYDIDSMVTKEFDKCMEMWRL